MYQTDRTSACGSSKERRHTPSTKGKSLFSLLLHPRSSMDSTTKAQSLQNKPSVPLFYQERLHKDCWTTTSEGQESLWESRHCSSSHSTLGTLLYSQSVGSQGKDYPFNSLIQDQNIDLSRWKAPKKKERRGLQKPPVSYQWTPTVRRVSSSQTLTAELKISTRKKVFMHKISQKISTNKDNKMIYTPPAASEFELQIPEAEKQIKTPKQ